MTRKAAAQQLGDVVKLHPHELNNLLSKVIFHLPAYPLMQQLLRDVGVGLFISLFLKPCLFYLQNSVSFLLSHKWPLKNVEQKGNAKCCLII